MCKYKELISCRTGVSAGGGGWEPLGQPYFDNSTKREATAAVGQPAYLHCRVRNLADRANQNRERDQNRYRSIQKAFYAHAGGAAAMNYAGKAPTRKGKQCPPG
ncbi:hypothetical protein EVAR_56240_1 [Eumeta japonica]|uniref:Ig-like domain-containing protein n=1 Tax=Eumeta variegata TaxID=151549 RepID=A0A4C1XID0_EUMVA|nr:hypothetical protein EVAR_56240_1 [Eumeta japonica]